jgi:hypothetical protein
MELRQELKANVGIMCKHGSQLILPLPSPSPLPPPVMFLYYIKWRPPAVGRMRMQRTRKGLGQRSRLCTGKFYLFIRRIIFYADEPSAGLLFMRKTVFESGAYRWTGMTWRGTAKGF